VTFIAAEDSAELRPGPMCLADFFYHRNKGPNTVIEITYVTYVTYVTLFGTLQVIFWGFWGYQNLVN
jgi:hypothetical protein